jgi:hypothetical protein
LCQNGFLSNNQVNGVQNRRCQQYLNQNCNARGLVQLSQQQCYQCQACNNGFTFNAASNTCEKPSNTSVGSCIEGESIVTGLALIALLLAQLD